MANPVSTACSAHTNSCLALTHKGLQQKAKITSLRISIQGLLRFLPIGFKTDWTLDSFHICLASAQWAWGCLTAAGPVYQQREALTFTRVIDWILVIFSPKTFGIRQDINSTILSWRLKLPQEAWCFFPSRVSVCLYIKQFFGPYPLEFTELLALFHLSACLRGAQASTATGTNWDLGSVYKCLRLSTADAEGQAGSEAGVLLAGKPGHPTWEPHTAPLACCSSGNMSRAWQSSRIIRTHCWGSCPAQQGSHSSHWVLGAAGGEAELTLHLKAQQNETFETLLTRTTGLFAGGKYVLLKLLQYWCSA